MLYVADTHALVRYVAGKLPKKAESIFQKSEKGKGIIFLPTIVLAETRHLVQNKKVELDFPDLLKNKKVELDFPDLLRMIELSSNFIPVPFDFQILKLLPDEVSEIHDQVIVATSKFLNAKLITKDPEIQNSGIIECVWN